MNYLYGILTDGIVSEDVAGYRYTDCVRSNSTQKLLNDIIGKTPEVVAAKADLIIKLMRANPCWSAFINKYDPINSYEEPVYPVQGVIPNSFYQDLKKWSSTLSLDSKQYPISNHDDFMQKIINYFYIIATTK